jgi:hypothetical protein
VDVQEAGLILDRGDRRRRAGAGDVAVVDTLAARCEHPAGPENTHALQEGAA